MSLFFFRSLFSLFLFFFFLGTQLHAPFEYVRRLQMTPLVHYTEFEKHAETEPMKSFLKEIVTAVIPPNLDDFTTQRKKQMVFSALLTLCYAHSDQLNWFQVASSVYHDLHHLSRAGLDALHHQGQGVSLHQLDEIKAQIVFDHLLTTARVISIHRNQLFVANLDDYHNIHKPR